MQLELYSWRNKLLMCDIVVQNNSLHYNSITENNNKKEKRKKNAVFLPHIFICKLTISFFIIIDGVRVII